MESVKTKEGNQETEVPADKTAANSDITVYNGKKSFVLNK